MKYINEEIEKEKANAIIKRNLEKDALQKTLRENEENKRIQALMREKEKLEDIRSIEEYTRVLEKQENERKLYFKNIENKSSNFLAKMSQTVLKDIENKNQAENERIKKYEQEKEERLLAQEKRKLEEIKMKKQELKKFYDAQVEEKRKEKEFQDMLNKEQARIWGTDKSLQLEQSSYINSKVSLFNLINKLRFEK